MSSVTNIISSEDAELILVALAMRSKQKGLSSLEQDRAEQLGKYLNVRCEVAFGWDKLDRIKLLRKPIKHVSVKCYDVAPED